MIRNIVFDMGGVLVEYQPDRVVREFVEDEAERRAVCTSVFVSPEWIMLDMGVISEEAALARMQARLDTDHAREMAAKCLAHWHEYNMWPKEGAGDLVRVLLRGRSPEQHRRSQGRGHGRLLPGGRRLEKAV